MLRAVLFALVVFVLSCGTSLIVVQREHLDSATVRNINHMLAGADVEVELRGGVSDAPLLRGRKAFLLSPPSLLAVGEKDTVAVPIEYIHEVRSSYRTTGRLAVGTLAGFLVGTAVGLVVTPTALFPIGVGGAVVGLTVGALSSQRSVVRFESAQKPAVK